MQANAPPLLISIVRRSAEILALVSKPDQQADELRGFKIESCPLDSIGRSLYPQKESLQKSWRYLANVKAADEATLYHVLTILIESVPDLSIAASPPLLPINWGQAPV